MDFGVGDILGIGSAVGSLIGGFRGSSAAKKAAQQQISALQGGQDYLNSLYSPFINRLTNMKMYHIPEQLLYQQPDYHDITQYTPYREYTPFQPTMAQLEQTPGYQWALDQGLRGTQNNLTKQGLGKSGPAVQAAGKYAQGLASQTYQQQYGNYVNDYNMGLGSHIQNWQNLVQGQQLDNTLKAARQKVQLENILAANGQALQAMGIGGNALNALGNSMTGLYTGIGNAGAAGTIGSTNQSNMGLMNFLSGLQGTNLLNARGFGGTPLFSIGGGSAGGGNSLTGGWLNSDAINSHAKIAQNSSFNWGE